VMMKGAELLTTITWILLTPACAFRNPSIDHNNMTRHSFHFSSEISINFDVSGEGARPLLLLHGFGASMESWNDILPDLARMFRVYRLDLKGHGLSSKPRDGAYSISEQARIVAAFIREYKLSNVTLIGHSYGGSVALMTYVGFAESPETNPVAKMVLIDCAGYPQEFPFFVSLLRKPVIGSLAQNLVPARVRAKYTLDRLFYDPSKIKQERIERYARYFDLPGAHYALSQCARQIIPADVDTFLRKIPEIAVPTLILWGANDSVIPLSIGRRLNRDIASSQLVIIDGCGHVPQEEKPSEAVAVLLRFLGGG